MPYIKFIFILFLLNATFCDAQKVGNKKNQSIVLNGMVATLDEKGDTISTASYKNGLLNGWQIQYTTDFVLYRVPRCKTKYKAGKQIDTIFTYQYLGVEKINFRRNDTLFGFEYNCNTGNIKSRFWRVEKNNREENFTEYFFPHHDINYRTFKNHLVENDNSIHHWDKFIYSRGDKNTSLKKFFFYSNNQINISNTYIEADTSNLETIFDTKGKKFEIRKIYRKNLKIIDSFFYADGKIKAIGIFKLKNYNQFDTLSFFVFNKSKKIIAAYKPNQKRLSINRVPMQCKFGLIDYNNQWIGQNDYDAISPTCGGYWLVVRGNKFGLQSPIGKTLIQPVFDELIFQSAINKNEIDTLEDNRIVNRRFTEQHDRLPVVDVNSILRQYELKNHEFIDTIDAISNHVNNCSNSGFIYYRKNTEQGIMRMNGEKIFSIQIPMDTIINYDSMSGELNYSDSLPVYDTIIQPHTRLEMTSYGYVIWQSKNKKYYWVKNIYDEKKKFKCISVPTFLNKQTYYISTPDLYLGTRLLKFYHTNDTISFFQCASIENYFAGKIFISRNFMDDNWTLINQNALPIKNAKDITLSSIYKQNNSTDFSGTAYIIAQHKNRDWNIFKNDELITTQPYDSLIMILVENTINEKEYFFIARQNKKFGLINNQGKILVPFIYDLIDALTYRPEDEHYNYNRTHKLVAKKNNKYGVIDFENNEIVPFQYHAYFNNFMASYCLYDSINNKAIEYQVADEGISKWAYFSQRSKDWSLYAFSIYDENYRTKIGVMNMNGDVLVKPVFISAENYENGFRLIDTAQNEFIFDLKNGLQPNIPFESYYRDIHKYDYGKYIAVVSKGHHVGIANADFHFLLDTTYYLISPNQSATHFCWVYNDTSINALALCDSFFLKNYYGIKSGILPPFHDNWKLYNLNTKTLLPLTFNEPTIFLLRNIFYTVNIAKSNNKWGVINEEGKVIIPFHYKLIFFHDDRGIENDSSYYLVCDTNNLIGMFNHKGKKIIPNIYKNLSYFLDEKMLGMKEDSSFVVLNRNGTKLGEIAKNGSSNINLLKWIWSDIQTHRDPFYFEERNRDVRNLIATMKLNQGNIPPNIYNRICNFYLLKLFKHQFHEWDSEREIGSAIIYHFNELFTRSNFYSMIKDEPMMQEKDWSTNSYPVLKTASNVSVTIEEAYSIKNYSIIGNENKLIEFKDLMKTDSVSLVKINLVLAKEITAKKANSLDCHSELYFVQDFMTSFGLANDGLIYYPSTIYVGEDGIKISYNQLKEFFAENSLLNQLIK